MLKQDEDGRYALSSREYTALQQLFGLVHASNNETLKARLQLIPGGWRDMRLIAAKSQALLEALFATVSFKKLHSIQRELNNTICEVKIKAPSGHSKDHVFISRTALVRLMERAIYTDCYLCEKTIKECKQCPLYQDLNDCFPYELAEPENPLCPFDGVSHLSADE